MEFTQTLPMYPDIPSPTCIHCMRASSEGGFARVCDAIQGHSQEGIKLDIDAYLCDQCSMQAAQLFGGLSKLEADALRNELKPAMEENERLRDEVHKLRQEQDQFRVVLSGTLEKDENVVT